MAWIRLLPSKRWAATVYTPDGRKTKTFDLKGSAEKWAGDLERDIRHQDYIDPDAGRATVGACWEELRESRRLEKASKKRDDSHWKCHVGPRWAKTEVRGVLKPTVQDWVAALEEKGVGASTIVGSLKVLKAVIEHAVDSRRLRSNPVRGVKPPVIPAHLDRVIEPDEEDLIYGRLDELFPDRPAARLFVETLFETGGRWEEVAAISPQNVLRRRKRIRLLPIMERDGTVRDYPKTAVAGTPAEAREVPVSGELINDLEKAFDGLPMTLPGFRTTTGGYVTYSNWLHRIWQPVMRVPVIGKDGKRVKGEDGKLLWEPLLDSPLPTPHDIRHTYGSRLADGGLEVHDIMKLMGHVDLRSAQRYIHSGEKRFDRAREALSRARRR